MVVKKNWVEASKHLAGDQSLFSLGKVIGIAAIICPMQSPPSHLLVPLWDTNTACSPSHCCTQCLPVRPPFHKHQSHTLETGLGSQYFHSTYLLPSSLPCSSWKYAFFKMTCSNALCYSSTMTWPFQICCVMCLFQQFSQVGCSS